MNIFNHASRIPFQCCWMVAALLLTSCAHGADVAFDLSDFTTSGVSNRRVIMSPTSTPRVSAARIILSDRVSFTTDAAGQHTVSNVVAGYYTVSLQGPPNPTQFTIAVPDTNGVVVAADLLVASTSSTFPNGTTAWSMAASDARYWMRTESVGSDGGAAQTAAYATNSGYATNAGTATSALWAARTDEAAWAFNAGSAQHLVAGPVLTNMVGITTGTRWAVDVAGTIEGIDLVAGRYLADASLPNTWTNGLNSVVFGGADGDPAYAWVILSEGWRPVAVGADGNEAILPTTWTLPEPLSGTVQSATWAARTNLTDTEIRAELGRRLTESNEGVSVSVSNLNVVRGAIMAVDGTSQFRDVQVGMGIQLGTPDVMDTIYAPYFVGDGSGLTNLAVSIPEGVLTNNQTGVSLAGTFAGDGSGLTNLPVVTTRYGSSLGSTNIVLDLGTNEYENITITNDIWVTTTNLAPMRWKVVKFLNTNNFQVHVQWPTNWSWASLVPEFIQSGRQFVFNATSFGTNDEDVVGSWTGYLSMARPLLIPGQVPEPRAYWRMDETVTNAARVDQINYANLTPMQYWRNTNDNSIWTNYAPGVVGSAWFTSASNAPNYAQVIATTNQTTAGPYSLAMWVRINAYAAGTTERDIVQCGTLGGAPFYFRFSYVDRYFLFRHATNNVSSGGLGVQSAYQYDLGTWYFVGAGWDGTNAWLTTTPFNGYSINPRVLQATSGVPTNSLSSSVVFTAGLSAAITPKGEVLVDEVGFWKENLSDAALMTIFTAGKNGQHIK
jgi:hypothetical protein